MVFIGKSGPFTWITSNYQSSWTRKDVVGDSCGLFPIKKIIPMTSSQSCWSGSVYVWQIPRFKIVDVHSSNMFLSCPAFPVDFTIFLTAFSLDPQRQRTNDSCLWATFSPRYKRDNPRNGDLFTRGISYWVVKNYEWPVKMSATCSLSSCKHLAVLKRTHIRCSVAGMHLPRI